ncbi:LuxR C-terminal-related transcriptional regulator [Streptomyces sp. NPDC001046]|uniref:LuxR C-terminal-related transcriptional regulator n=1 Tax=Streptomyces sp. NPDC001046 TaxID=3364543 RepID=UPI0036CF3D1C
MAGELTAREREIVHLIGRGLINKEIGTELFVSSKTVEYRTMCSAASSLRSPERRSLNGHRRAGAIRRDSRFGRFGR